MDFVASSPLPERLHEPLERALRGDASALPDDVSATEVRILAEHGVVPLLYATTHHPALRNDAIHAAAAEAVRAADLHEVLEALAPYAPVVMKGTALAYQLYVSPDLRPRGDTDLLISASAVEPVRAAMQALGFAELPGSRDEHGYRQAIFTRNGIAYDVHWSATNIPLFDDLLRFEELSTVPLPGFPARALAPVEALLLACIHRVAHHHDSDRLIWLADIALLRDALSPDEHARFWRLAAAGRAVRVCMRSIELANEWFSRAPVQMAGEYLTAAELQQEEPSAVFLDREITHGRVMLASLRALSWKARARRVWQLAFPPAAFVRQSFGARGSAVLPLLYVYRGARGVRRLFRRVVATKRTL